MEVLQEQSMGLQSVGILEPSDFGALEAAYTAAL